MVVLTIGTRLIWSGRPRCMLMLMMPVRSVILAILIAGIVIRARAMVHVGTGVGVAVGIATRTPTGRGNCPADSKSAHRRLGNLVGPPTEGVGHHDSIRLVCLVDCFLDGLMDAV